MQGHPQAHIGLCLVIDPHIVIPASFRPPVLSLPKGDPFDFGAEARDVGAGYSVAPRAATGYGGLTVSVLKVAPGPLL